MYYSPTWAIAWATWTPQVHRRSKHLLRSRLIRHRAHPRPTIQTLITARGKWTRCKEEVRNVVAVEQTPEQIMQQEMLARQWVKASLYNDVVQSYVSLLKSTLCDLIYEP